MNQVSFPESQTQYFTQEELLQLSGSAVPTHIAMILDGNRRWAKGKERKLVTEGHRAGADNLVEILKSAKELGVKVMTLYVFSTENWLREPDEVSGLMWLFENYIRWQIPAMIENKIAFKTIGDIQKLPESVQGAIEEAKDATDHFKEMKVVFAMNYGARDEIKRAVQKMMANGVQSEEVTEDLISSYLDTADYPDPDLLIRTGGEDRISNFLLWQLSYTELYTTSTLLPDFTPKDLLQAVLEYQMRERRLGL